MFSSLEKSESLKKTALKLSSGKSCTADSVNPSFKAFLYSYLASASGKDLVIITSSDNVYPLYGEMLSLKEIFGHGAGIAAYPEDDSLLYTQLKASREVSGERAAAIKLMLSPGRKIIITDINAASEKIASPGEADGFVFDIKAGAGAGMEELITALNNNGYERRVKASECFEYSVRGSILDIYAPGGDYPVRIEFFGDTVESVRYFSPDTFDTTHSVKEARLFIFNPGGPARRGNSSILEYLKSTHTAVITDGLESLKGEILEKINKIERYIDPKDAEKNLFTFRALLKRVQKYPKLKVYETAVGGGAVSIKASNNPVFDRDMARLFGHLTHQAEKKHAVYIASDNQGETEHLKSMIAAMAEEKKAPAPAVKFINADVYRGFIFPEAKLCVISNREIFDRYKGKVLSRVKDKNLKALKHYTDLEKGDFVVHREHGIGVFEGVRNMDFDGITGDFLYIKYHGDDKLYIPVYKIDLIDKYTGSDKAPVLSKLGTQVFRRSKEAIEREMKEMAAELLKIYASRKSAPGIKYGESDAGVKAFENAFIFEETPDQAKAIDDVMEDMEKEKQMDRLVCGDAGFGKTEVAMRAAFKAVNGGRQVLVLTATTLLAAQHLNSFRERMADYPIRIEMLSRLVKPADRKKILNSLKEGKTDILIGTHAVLSASVELKNPGLVIIDEEQHFGVKNKENLRKKYPSADLLTLTATPIPRTLYFSMSGIRDISIIQTPPPGKKAIETVIIQERMNVLREIILREVLRKGQVFYVHNSIKTLEKTKENLQKILPEIRFKTAHGQMDKGELERLMADFLDKKFDVLITTTIVESGLDMPDVNTIIVSGADRFGLSQLYQLRGRVGRRDRQAYAYMMVNDVRSMTETARERLKTIESYVDPGAGFSIAMRDLEQRGAGNILGTKQHGYMEKIGFEMYCRMLEEAVAELEGEVHIPEKDTKIKTDFEAHIPDEYVWDTGEKVRIYRRIFAAQSVDEAERVKKQVEDAWGKMPQEALNVFNVLKLKIAGRLLAADEISVTENEMFIVWYEKPSIGPRELSKAGVKGVSLKEGVLHVKLKGIEEALSALDAYCKAIK